MSRPFTLPIVIACSAHALLMFGFKKPEVIKEEKTVCVDPGVICIFPLPPEEPPVVTPAAGENMPGVKSEVPPPSIQETPPTTVSFDDITMDPARRHPHIPVTTKVIPGGIYTPGDVSNPNGKPGGGDGIIFGSLALDNTPRTRLQNPPSYPFSLKSSGISGEVVVEFVVDEHGRVLSPRVLRSTHPDFESPTLAAVSKWRFEPGTRNMAPVRFKMVVPVKFNLND